MARNRKRASRAKRSLLAFAHPYESGAHATGVTMPTEHLVARIRTFSWSEALVRIANLAALVANTHDGVFSEVVRSKTVDPLLELTGPATGLIDAIKKYVAANRNSIVLAHEEALNYLQHLVLLEGADSGADAPSDSELALWLLGFNDHVEAWEEEDARPLSDSEKLFAGCTHGLRFNNAPDWMCEIVRAYGLFSQTPARGGLADGSSWASLQTAAFGASFRDYFESFFYPLALIARRWGVTELPIIRPNVWLSQTRIDSGLAADLFSALTIDRNQAVGDIRKRLRSDGLPHAPTVLLKKPLIKLDGDALVCASPWAIRAQMHAGIWARHLNAAKQQFGSGGKGAQIWLSTFGDLFELWCRRVAEESEKSQWFRPTLLLPSHPGAVDEIEDIVLIESRAAVLFSAKARLVVENVARQAHSRTDLIDWYEEFFFGQATGEHRQGAARLLDARIELVRAGEFEPRLHRSARLIPVLLTYDSLCEHTLLYRWLQARCKEERLLQQKDVAPLTLARIDEFELLMAMAARGDSVVGILRQREGAWRDRRLGELLYANRPRSRGNPTRLPFLTELFDQLAQATTARLFTAGPGGC